ncbi:hypothetical protein D9M71_668770 [compost metagenome]
MLVGPQLAGPGVECCALLVAVAERPDLGADIVLADKRIVLRHRAVRQDAHHLALQLVQVLGGRTLVVFPQGNEQVSVTVEHQPRAKVQTCRQLGLLAEDHVEIF